MPIRAQPSCIAPRGLFATHLFAVATPTVISGQCKRPTTTLLLSTNDKPFTLQLGDSALIHSTAVLVAPGQARSLRAVDCNLVSVNVEPGHTRSTSLRAKLDSFPAIVLDRRRFASMHAELRLVFEGGPDAARTLAAVDLLLDAAGAACSRGGMDSRVVEVLQHIHAQLPRRVPLDALARSVGLSTDRLSHLFVDAVGTPLRSYVVWQRYKLALARLSAPAALTPLALDCGFSDAAHMTRTFVEFFGFPPSLLARSGFVQDFA